MSLVVVIGCITNSVSPTNQLSPSTHVNLLSVVLPGVTGLRPLPSQPTVVVLSAVTVDIVVALGCGSETDDGQLTEFGAVLGDPIEFLFARNSIVMESNPTGHPASTLAQGISAVHLARRG